MQRLQEILGEYAQSGAVRFHMPGHKGRGMGGFFSDELIGCDVTELSFSDDLHAPEAALLRLQQSCATIYGASHSFLLVNGSTSGLHAMMLSLPEGSELIVGRDSHRAVFAGAALAGHKCRYLLPEYEPLHGVWGVVTAKSLKEAFEAAPAKAVLVTSPTYYGFCADLKALSEVAHSYGALLFVDAAHGAHFPFSVALPEGPAPYADAWVVSAHKTLNALGQAALLHINSTMKEFALSRALSLVQTSSPSYLLLLSLDWACYTARLNNVWTKAASACEALAEDISALASLKTLPRSLIGKAGIIDIDKTRLVIDVSGRSTTGYAAKLYLEAHNIFVEMAGERHLVCICTPSDDPSWYKMLLESLSALPNGPIPQASKPEPFSVNEQVLSLREAMLGKAELCPLSDCSGRIAAQAVGIYPPGIPLWVPGECIHHENLAYLLEQQAKGASLFGVNKGSVAVVG